MRTGTGEGGEDKEGRGKVGQGEGEGQGQGEGSRGAWEKENEKGAERRRPETESNRRTERIRYKEEEAGNGVREVGEGKQVRLQRENVKSFREKEWPGQREAQAGRHLEGNRKPLSFWTLWIFF